jgi:hypothetical protein
VWIKTSRPQTDTRTVLQYSSGTQLNAFTLQFWDSKVKATINGAQSTSGGGIDALDSAWNFEIIQWRGDTGAMTIYENGNQRGSWTAATGTLPSPGCLVVGHLSIGSCTPGSGYSGGFSSTQYWSGALAEVRCAADPLWLAPCSCN